MRNDRRGMTLLETVIAAALLMLLSMGTLPLLTGNVRLLEQDDRRAAACFDLKGRIAEGGKGVAVGNKRVSFTIEGEGGEREVTFSLYRLQDQETGETLGYYRRE